jgi:hypothetical protein
MRNLHLIAPPPFLVADNRIRIGRGLARGQSRIRRANSSNWAGNYANGHSNYGFVHASWAEPAIDTSCARSDVAMWVGLGGVAHTGTLAQDGTAFGAPGIGDHQAWFEILPAFPVPVNVTATRGKSFDAYTSRETQGGRAGYVFFLKNDSTGAGVSPFVASSSYDGNTADVITERTENLKNFDPFMITEADAAFGGTDHLFGSSLPHVGTFMFGKSRELAFPGSINGSGGWSMNYKNCN